MIKIYHNPRCSKSRNGISLLENSGKEFAVIEYLKEPLTKQHLSDLIQKLGISPLELVRKGEAIWKEQYKGKSLSDDQLIDIMIENPKLIERPIVVNEDKAVIGRPNEKIHDII